MNRQHQPGADVYSPVFLNETERDWLLASGVLPQLLEPETAEQVPRVLTTAEEEAAVDLLEAALLRSSSAHQLSGADCSKFGEPVDVALALDGTDPRTTVMMRKVPRRLVYDELLALLRKQTPGLEKQVEFLYLPRDVARRSNRGFCFINFHSHRGVGVLASLLQQSASPNPPLVPEPLAKCRLYYANVQGKGEELRRLIEQRQSLLQDSISTSQDPAATIPDLQIRPQQAQQKDAAERKPLFFQ